MSALRALVVLATLVLPLPAGTFGTVVAHAQSVADLALDEARRRLYVLNTGANAVEVFSTTTNPPRLTNTIKTNSTPLAIALSRNGKSLFVVCYGASSLDVVDVSTTA